MYQITSLHTATAKIRAHFCSHCRFVTADSTLSRPGAVIKSGHGPSFSKRLGRARRSTPAEKLGTECPIADELRQPHSWDEQPSGLVIGRSLCFPHYHPNVTPQTYLLLDSYGNSSKPRKRGCKGFAVNKALLFVTCKILRRAIRAVREHRYVALVRKRLRVS